MNNIYKNKICLSIIIFALFATPFFYLLNLHPSNMSSASYWIQSFILSFLFLYIVFISSSLIQIVLIKLLNVFKLKTFSLYPITYDGKFRLHPLSLIFNIDGFCNSLLLNLCEYLTNEVLLKKKLKQLLVIRKFSILVIYSFFFIILQNYDAKTAIVCIISALSTILLSYFQYGHFWYGYDYLNFREINYLKAYLLSCKGIKFINAQAYTSFLQISNARTEFLLPILENYLYKCIIEWKTTLPSEQINKLLDISSETKITYDLYFDSKYMSIIRLIGWTGIKCNDAKYISLSIERLRKIKTNLLINASTIISERSSAHIQHEIDYLNDHSNNEFKLQIQNYQNVYSIYESIFQGTKQVSFSY